MATDEITTIKVYKKDRRWLEELFGQPTHRAFRLALAKASCQHPEGKRTYVMGLVPVVGEHLQAGVAGKRIPGFYCAACESYIFPSAGISVDAPREGTDDGAEPGSR